MSLQHIHKASSSGEALFYAWFPAMHTRVDLAFCGTHTEDRLLALAQGIQQELHRLEAMANYFDPTSELATLNRLAATRDTALSEELYTLIDFCQEAHTRTLGYFDVSVGSEPHHPHTMQRISLSPTRHTARFDEPGICLNLSGLLKGYAIDRIQPMLAAHNVQHALINLGNSSILAQGNHPAGSGWKVDKEIVLHNQCLTTSGNDTDTRQHIADPHTGQLVTGKRKIAVTTTSGIWGEVCSTALFAAPDQHRPRLAEALKPELTSYRESV